MTEAAKTNKSVLIAEDDPFISTMYQTKLEQSGYTVHLLNNGRDAYDAIKKLHPDAIIMDINMPEITGLAVLAALKNEGVDVTATPTVVLTNSSDPKDHAEAKALGIQLMIKADSTPQQILEAIEAKFQTK